MTHACLRVGPATGAVLALVALALGCRGEAPVAPAAGSTIAADLLPGPGTRRHLVVLRQQAEPSSQLLAVIAAGGGQMARRHGAIGVFSVEGLGDSAATALAADTTVLAIGRDRLVRWVPPLSTVGASELAEVAPLGDQSDAFYFAAYQWNLRQVGADDAWLLPPSGSGALVCILDTGVDAGHVDLAGRVDLAASASFVPAEPDLADRHFHGTFVAAIVVSNGIGMASVAPDARLCAVKVLDRNGDGTIDDVVAGVLHAAAVGADIVNMSLGATLPARAPDTRALALALQRAVLFAVQHGALVVAGAGHDGLDLDRSDAVVIPAELPGVLAVGATAPLDQANFDRLASYTNHGRTSVDLMAPGGENLITTSTDQRDAILSACSRFIAAINCASGSVYVLGWGTSFAAPHVAGAAAVLESLIPGDQGGADLTTCLYRGADHPDGTPVSPRYGRGRVNVLRAIQSSGCGT